MNEQIEIDEEVAQGKWEQIQQCDLKRRCRDFNNKKDILFIERKYFNKVEEPPSLFIVAIGMFVAGMLSGLVAIHIAILIGNLISF